jgi:hypothetical protein
LIEFLAELLDAVAHLASSFFVGPIVSRRHETTSFRRVRASIGGCL